MSSLLHCGVRATTKLSFSPVCPPGPAAPLLSPSVALPPTRSPPASLPPLSLPCPSPSPPPPVLSLRRCCAYVRPCPARTAPRSGIHQLDIRMPPPPSPALTLSTGIKRFVALRRFERLPVHALTAGMKVSTRPLCSLGRGATAIWKKSTATRLLVSYPRLLTRIWEPRLPSDVEIHWREHSFVPA